MIFASDSGPLREVQMSEVDATHGMRAHIGMKAKLRKVDGIQTFHSAIRSSFMLTVYSPTALAGSGLSEVTKSLIM